MPDDLLFEEMVQPGAAWSHVLKRGTSLRLTDIDGGVNVGMLLYNFECPSERLNLPDTLKAQHIARITKDFVLYSDMGRILSSVTDDSLGWHDPIGGTSNAVLVLEKYGEATYQQCRNDYHTNGYDKFLIELAKWGLGERDITANVNFFSKVAVGSDGYIEFKQDFSGAGSFVELRAEMNVLVILNTCQHPLDPHPVYNPKRVMLTVRKVPPPAYNDPCRTSRPENGRGFSLTERYFM
jgi:urea carboxylase-associated protein 2